MILQKNADFPEEIQEYGCGLMSVIWHAARLEAIEIECTRDIIAIYNDAIAHDAIRDDCYIQDWEGLFKVCALDVKYTGRHETPQRDCADDEIEILRYPGHFVAGDGNGHTTYDPWGVSNAAQKRMRSKRVFKVV